MDCRLPIADCRLYESGISCRRTSAGRSVRSVPDRPWLRLAHRLGFALALAVLVGHAPTAPALAQEQSTSVDSDPWEITGDELRTTIQRIWIPKSRLVNGPYVRSAFREIVAQPNRATVRVNSGGCEAALGGIVGPDGWIVTKASCARGELTCVLSDGRELAARVVGIHRDHDVAMLKIEAEQLPVLDWKRSASVEVGQWVATPGLGPDPVAVGIVSVPARAIAHQPGILGIQLDESQDGPRVVRVFPDTGAAEAGILVNDVVTSINGAPTANRAQLQRQIRRHSPGEEIEVGIRRGVEVLSVTAVLTGYLANEQPTRRQFQNHLGGELSGRRSGFPIAFQHDAVLHPADCGGPLIDLNGQVIGFNIARAGRTESYAIPTSALVPLFYDLMSGNLSPLPEPPSAVDKAQFQQPSSGPSEKDGAGASAVNQAQEDLPRPFFLLRPLRQGLRPGGLIDRLIPGRDSSDQRRSNPERRDIESSNSRTSEL